MSREADYAEQLRALGIYEPAFDPAIKQLCQQERELSRVNKAWHATVPKGQTPSVLDKHYEVMQKLRAEISEQRDILGLTPRGLQKLRGKPKGDGTVAGETISRKLDLLLEKVSAYE